MEILTLGLDLLRNMSVIIVLAYVLTRTEFFIQIIKKEFTFQNKLLTTLIFGLFSIYGTLSGIEIFGAIANIRDLGPCIAGLVAGPAAGVGAGIIGGVHRFFLGGPTQIACTLSTILAGLISGLIFKYRKGRMLPLWGIMLFAAAVEAGHMGLALIFTRPFSLAVEIVKEVSVPMMAANALGLGIFFFMIINVLREKKAEAERKLLEGELKVAHDIQMGIIPNLFPPFPYKNEFDLYAGIIPAKEVGGDLYNFSKVDDDHLVFIIGDVSGKGVPASLFMAITMTLFLAGSENRTDPGPVLSFINRQLAKNNDACMFVTAFCGVLNYRTGELKISNAGHNPPILIQKDRADFINPARGVVLGAVEEMDYPTACVRLEPGDSLFLYTDGVTEAMDPQQELYSDERLLQDIRGMDRETDVEEIVHSVFDSVHQFAAGEPQSDDITAFIIRYNG
ncbi:MAG: PP2C family protein-serine/threonine phosphatase [Desulfonatronovibrionaceae bacterium]